MRAALATTFASLAIDRVYAKALRHQRPMTGFVRASRSSDISTMTVDSPPQTVLAEGLEHDPKTSAWKCRNETRLGRRCSGAVGVQEVGSSNLLGPTIGTANET